MESRWHLNNRNFGIMAKYLWLFLLTGCVFRSHHQYQFVFDKHWTDQGSPCVIEKELEDYDKDGIFQIGDVVHFHLDTNLDGRVDIVSSHRLHWVDFYTSDFSYGRIPLYCQVDENYDGIFDWQYFFELNNPHPIYRSTLKTYTIERYFDSFFLVLTFIFTVTLPFATKPRHK